jgi:hypothetical protein
MIHVLGEGDCTTFEVCLGSCLRFHVVNIFSLSSYLTENTMKFTFILFIPCVVNYLQILSSTNKRTVLLVRVALLISCYMFRHYRLRQGAELSRGS